jgi:hypothetical protein
MNQPSGRRDFETFLFLRGTHIVQLLLLLSLVANGVAAVRFFADGRLILCLWAALATVLLPRAVLALFLIRERSGALYANLSGMLMALYRRTVVRYQPMAYETYYSAGGASRAYLRECVKLAFWSVPLIVSLA